MRKKQQTKIYKYLMHKHNIKRVNVTHIIHLDYQE